MLKFYKEGMISTLFHPEVLQFLKTYFSFKIGRRVKKSWMIIKFYKLF